MNRPPTSTETIGFVNDLLADPKANSAHPAWGHLYDLRAHAITRRAKVARYHREARAKANARRRPRIIPVTLARGIFNAVSASQITRRANAARAFMALRRANHRNAVPAGTKPCP